jgi:hypothetical protein
MLCHSGKRFYESPQREMDDVRVSEMLRD